MRSNAKTTRTVHSNDVIQILIQKPLVAQFVKEYKVDTQGIDKAHDLQAVDLLYSCRIECTAFGKSNGRYLPSTSYE